MILKEQATLITNELNDIAKDLYENVVQDNTMLWDVS